MSRIVGKYAMHGSQWSWLENVSPSIIKSAVNRNICSIFINCSKIFAKDLTNSVILQNNSNQYLIRLTTSLVRYLITLIFSRANRFGEYKWNSYQSSLLGAFKKEGPFTQFTELDEVT